MCCISLVTDKMLHQLPMSRAMVASFPVCSAAPATTSDHFRRSLRAMRKWATGGKSNDSMGHRLGFSDGVQNDG